MKLLRKLLLFSAACIATAGFSQQQKKVADKIVAIIGDHIILQSDINNTLRDIEQQGEELTDNSVCLATQQAVMSKLLMIQAEKDSIIVSHEEVEAELDQRIRYFIKKFGTSQKVEEAAGKTISQLKKDEWNAVREKKLASVMFEKIAGKVKVTPAEVQAFFNKIPVNELPFFESGYEIGQIVQYPKPSAEMENYVIGELDHYKKMALEKVTTFSALADKYSEDKESNIRGGLYQLNRNDHQFPATFVAAAFRLKVGEISSPFRTPQGYHVILMEERNGDDAIIRQIFRLPAITEAEVNTTISKLQRLRSDLMTRFITFDEAAKKYSEDQAAQFSPYLLGPDGSYTLTLRQMDKDLVAALRGMRAGDISEPVDFTDLEGRKGLRLIYIKSRTEPHRMNLKDDYARIAAMAMAEKQQTVIGKWMNNLAEITPVTVDDKTFADCPAVQKFTTTEKSSQGH